MQNELKVAVGVLTNVAGEVLIAQRAGDAPMAGAWEFPGGKLDVGETAQAALVRELHEELGITPTYLRFLAELKHDYAGEDGMRRVRLHCWKVLAWDGPVIAAENQTLQWLQPDRLFECGLLEADRPLVELLTGHSRINTLSWQRVAESAERKV